MRAPKRIIKILGLDPGMSTTGFNISVYNPDTDILTVQLHSQIEAHSLAKQEMRKESKIYGNIVSLFLYEREIRNLMLEHQPDYVTSEDAFYNPRMPNAYLSLKLCINSIQRVLYEFGKTLYRIPPTVAKQAVRDGTADKLAVQEAVLSLPGIVIRDTKQNPVAKLTEHEADSIAIAYAFKKLYLLDILAQQAEKEKKK